MIEASHLSKTFGAVRALDDLTFRIDRGRITGFLGPNGAGKTTVMRILAGVFAPTSGRASIAGYDTITSSFEARRRLGYFPENAPYYPDVTVESYLRFVACLKEVADRQRSVAHVMERCGVAQVRHRLVGKLSKGYRQRVGLAQALLGFPEVLILDEPTVGLDPAQANEMRALIRGLGGDHTVLLSSHVVSEVERLCDDVIVIAEGRLMARDSPARLAEKLGRPLHVRLRVDTGADAARGLLEQIPGVRHVAVDGDAIRFDAADEQIVREVSRAVRDRQWLVLEIRQDPADLEEIFLSLVRNGGVNRHEAERPKAASS